MHVLLATPAFPPLLGGGERHVGSLAAHLIARGISVTVFTSAALQEPDFWQGTEKEITVEKSDPGLTIIRVPIEPMPGGFRGLLAWRKSMVMLSSLPGTLNTLQKMAGRVPALAMTDETLSYIEKPVDVVHGFNISWEYAMMVGCQYAQQNHIPFIATPFAHLGRGSHDRVALNSTMRHQLHMLSTADLVLATTPVESRELQARGIDRERIKVASAGLDIPDPVVPMPEIDDSLKPYLLFVGRTSHDKGAIHAAQAVLHLRGQGINRRLVFIGRETDEFRRFYEKLPAADRQALHVLGFVDEEVKHAFLRSAEALLLPSSSDSFGIVMLESWLYGRPVIAADAGGIPAVVDDGENGILVPFGDVSALSSAIKLLAENQELNQAMGENGRRKLMTRYTWDIVTEDVLTAYRGIESKQLV